MMKSPRLHGNQQSVLRTAFARSGLSGRNRMFSCFQMSTRLWFVYQSLAYVVPTCIHVQWHCLAAEPKSGEILVLIFHETTNVFPSSRFVASRRNVLPPLAVMPAKQST